jgi:pimeloyl-ACP methyl ester carboxylesterase
MVSRGICLEYWLVHAGRAVAISERGPSRRVAPRGTLLLLHGRLCDATLFHGLVQRLRPRYRCLLVDLPGHGRSRDCPSSLGALEHAELVRRIVGRHAPEGVLLVGHDTGGAVAQFCAWCGAFPVRGLVLINGTSVLRPLPSFAPGPGGWRTRLWLRGEARRCAGAARQFARDVCRDWAHPASRRAMLRTGRMFAENWPGPEERRYWRERCASFSAPTLVLRGRRESLNPVDADLELVRWSTEGHYHEHAEGGHWLCREDPAWVEAKLRELLFRLEEAEPTSELPRLAGS